MTILVTGGAGFIGSHSCVALLENGYNVVVVDNFSNSYPSVLKSIEKIAHRSLIHEPGDIRDQNFVEEVLRRHKCQAVIHFAGLKAVGESSQRPLDYYECNVLGTLRLLQAMQAQEVKKMIFSSTATVYGAPLYLPYDEKHPLQPESPYGRTKLIIENMLGDIYVSDERWKIAILRYFNPVGAHASGLIGENPKGVPNNLMPLVAQVASGQRKKVTVWGDDYDTNDGSGVRDYIHVVDLADGHVRALQFLQHEGVEIFNFGCGKGYSVFEVIKAFERVSNKKIAYEIGPRRPGDIGEFYANPARAQRKLGWQARRGLSDICADMWNFQMKSTSQ